MLDCLPLSRHKSLNGVEMKIWQVAAGDGTRDYTKVFLKYGVILVGPGSAGDYFQNKEVYNSAESKDYRPFIRVIAEDMNQDDLVILKQPQGQSWKIVAVGRVTSDYLHKEVFGDVEGWDLQHSRLIQWRIRSILPLSMAYVEELW